MELLTPKVQINVSHRTNAAGEILDRSTLLNIRTDDVLEAIQLFNQLRLKMDGHNAIAPARQTVDDNIPVIEQEEPKVYNWPFETNEPAPQCPECGAHMVKRNGKNGNFWGCSNFRKGCRGTRQI